MSKNWINQLINNLTGYLTSNCLFHFVWYGHMVEATSLGFYYVIEQTWDNFVVWKNPTGSDRKWPKMTSLVKIQFLTDFELFFGRVFLDFWKMLHQYFILDTPETGCGSAIYNMTTSSLIQRGAFSYSKVIGWINNPGLSRVKLTILLSTNDVNGFFIVLYHGVMSDSK